MGRDLVLLPDRSLNMARDFGRIAARQLRGEALGADEVDRLTDHRMELENALNDGRAHGASGGLLGHVDRRTCVTLARSFSPDAVRWAGRGVCPIYAVVEFDGRLHVCRGGVFDYREFDLPPGRALDREAFRRLMDSPAAPKAPGWTGSYRVEPDGPSALRRTVKETRAAVLAPEDGGNRSK